jgi:hypothetical protein
MSKNVHSEEEWDILSDPEDNPNMDNVITENNEVKIEIKETKEPTGCGDDNVLRLEIMIDDIEKKVDSIERRRNIKMRSPVLGVNKLENKKLIGDDDELCGCLVPYLNSNGCDYIKKNVCKIL